MLEYKLDSLWEQRDQKGTVTWDTYRQLGGVEGALAAHADAILQEKYDPEQREALHHLLLKLIQPIEGAVVRSRRAF